MVKKYKKYLQMAKTQNLLDRISLSNTSHLMSRSKNAVTDRIKKPRFLVEATLKRTHKLVWGTTKMQQRQETTLTYILGRRYYGNIVILKIYQDYEKKIKKTLVFNS